MDVVGHEYVSDGKRMINRFLLERIGISSSLEYTGAAADLDDGAEDIPLEEDGREAVETGERKARSSIFRRRVKEYYSGRCAICGSDRKTNGSLQAPPLGIRLRLDLGLRQLRDTGQEQETPE